jgi:hypothetical protein
VRLFSEQHLQPRPDLLVGSVRLGRGLRQRRRDQQWNEQRHKRRNEQRHEQRDEQRHQQRDKQRDK